MAEVVSNTANIYTLSDKPPVLPVKQPAFEIKKEDWQPIDITPKEEVEIPMNLLGKATMAAGAEKAPLAISFENKFIEKQLKEVTGFLDPEAKAEDKRLLNLNIAVDPQKIEKMQGKVKHSPKNEQEFNTQKNNINRPPDISSAVQLGTDSPYLEQAVIKPAQKYADKITADFTANNHPAVIGLTVLTGAALAGTASIYLPEGDLNQQYTTENKEKLREGELRIQNVGANLHYGGGKLPELTSAGISFQHLYNGNTYTFSGGSAMNLGFEKQTMQNINGNLSVQLPVKEEASVFNIPLNKLNISGNTGVTCTPAGIKEVNGGASATFESHNYKVAASCNVTFSSGQHFLAASGMTGNISLTPVNPVEIYGLKLQEPVNFSVTAKNLSQSDSSYEARIDTRISKF